MIYLAEREVGFDTERLGFPSIDACRAVVLLTRSGLFGFHNYGNANPKQDKTFAGTGYWAKAAEWFASYIAGHPSQSAGIHLYFAARIDGGSYTKPGKNLKQCGAEARVFAKALDYKGPISCADITTLTPSAYVEFRASGSSCIILARVWQRSAADGAVKSPYVAGPNHAHSMPGKAMPGSVYTGASPDGCVQVTPQLVRS
ncbi:MAG TPA: hypothetical protein VGG62_03150 [Terracidiphilus sp.]